MPQSSPQRTKPTVPVKRVDTIVLDDSDDEGNHASTSTPATSIGTPRREEESTKTDERAEESIDVEIVEPASAPENKPVTLKDAFKNVIKKAKIYTQKLEEFQRKRNAWLAEKKAAEADYDDPSTGSKKRKAKASLPPKKSKKKRSQKEEDAKKELPFEVPVPAAIKARLKDYQVDGFNWLYGRYMFATHGAILADEMGTGKTLQSITLLSFIYEAFGAKQPAIVVLPKAVQQNWAEELKRWAPSLPFMVYAGTKDERALLREKLGIKAARTPLAEGDAVAKLGAVRAKAEVARWPRSDPNRTKPYPIILVTYNILLRDIVWLWQLTYSLIVCDEAHKAKNLSGKTLNSLKYLRGDFRLLLTGTPLQNNLTELYALLSFILPQIFNDRELFEQQFDFSAVVSEEGHRISEQEEVQLLVAQLHEILSPYMLRRCKKDVIKDLPLKKEYVLTAKMTKQQKEMTEAALEGQLRAYLAGTTTDNSRESTPRLSNGRGSRDADIINPALLNEKGRRTRKRESRSYKEEMHESMDDDEFEQQLAVEVEAEEKRAREKEVAKLQGAGKRDFDLRAKHTKFNSMMTNLRQIANHPLLKQDTRMPKDDPELIVKLSGKMMLLDRLLPALLERGHKIIIFSQFVKMLDLLDDYIELRGLKRFRLDGQAEYKADQDEIREFNTAECTEESTNIFLVSTKAGGVGINLVGADTVIIFDSDWNPQNDLQAMDRAHRIGQTKPVLVFRLASANSIEQTLLASATRKRKLERVVLGNEAALAGDGASAASSFINGVKGKKPGKGQAKNEAIKTLAQKLLEAEGELVSLDEGDEILSDEQLESLLDRSDEAMTSTESSKPTAGKQAAFEVVETIEEETIQQENLLGGVLGDIADLTTATTTDEEDDDEIDDAQ